MDGPLPQRWGIVTGCPDVYVEVFADRYLSWWQVVELLINLLNVPLGGTTVHSGGYLLH